MELIRERQGGPRACMDDREWMGRGRGGHGWGRRPALALGKLEGSEEPSFL